MNDLNKALVQKITELASQESFIHHKWFLKYHLEIIQKISDELCTIYTNADKDMVTTLVWIHDFAKICNLKLDVPSEEIKSVLNKIGFNSVYIDKLIEYLAIFEKKMEIDLHNAPIEVQIVSSADGAAHMVGPFNSIYLYENPDKEIDDLLQGNVNKMNKDCERKIVLPEVKKSFEERRKFSLENNGQLPDKYLS